MAKYANAAALRVPESRGLGTALWQFDANGDPVFQTNNAPVYDLDRIVEANSTSNTSHNHPLLEPVNMNPDYQQFNDLYGAQMARPFSGQLLERLQRLDNYGLTNVYYYNSQPGTNPADTGVYT